jgi:hypothetical protein
MDNSIDEILSYLADETTRLESTETAAAAAASALSATVATMDVGTAPAKKKKGASKKAPASNSPIVKRKLEQSSGDPSLIAAVKRFQTNKDNKNTLTKAVDIFNKVGKKDEAIALQDFIEKDFDEAMEILKTIMPDSSIEPMNSLPVGGPWNWDLGKDIDSAVKIMGSATQPRNMGKDIMESAITLHHSNSAPSGKSANTVSSEPVVKKPKWKPVPEADDTASDIHEPWILCPPPQPAMPIPWHPMEDAPTLLLAACLFLCTNCFNELRDVQNCMQLPGGRVILTHSMCQTCAKINVDMKNVLYNYNNNNN